MADKSVDQLHVAKLCRPQPDQSAGDDQGDQQGRPAWQEKLQGTAEDQREKAEGQRRLVDLVPMIDQCRQASECRGLAGDVEPEQIRQLPQGNDDRCAQGEAQHH